jgi:hypothetical protein
VPKLGRTTPCAECPWRTTSLRGYLGTDEPVHFYWQSVTVEGMMPCHEQIDYEDPDWKQTQLPGVDLCAGNLIHFRNTMKAPRRPELAAAVRAVKASRAVFTWPWEFMAHHMPRASQEEVKAAASRACLPVPLEEVSSDSAG